MMMTPGLRIALLLAVLAGCATAPETPPVAPASPPAAPPPTPAAKPAPTGPRLSKETLAYLSRRKLTPIAGGALNARADCNFRDDDGYRGQLLLAVRDSTVEHLDARIEVPKRGSCSFRLTDFRQTDTLPIVVLAAKKGACKVSLWEQGDQVTVAFRDCRTECGGNAADYLWPILVDNRKGSCS